MRHEEGKERFIFQVKSRLRLTASDAAGTEWNGEGLASNKWTNKIFKKHLLKRLLMALSQPLFCLFSGFSDNFATNKHERLTIYLLLGAGI